MPPFHDLASGRIQLSYAEHDAKLLFFLAYFDRVCVLPFNMPNAGIVLSTELEQTLVSQQIIQAAYPQQIRQTAGWDVDLIAGVAESVYTHLNSGEGSWAVAGADETVERLSSEESNALVMTLAGCLPAPAPSTPVADILAFKADHANDLSKLRHAVNKLALGFRGGVSEAEVRQVVETELLARVDTIATAFRKKGLPFFKPDLNISCALPRAAVVIAVEWIGMKLGAHPGTGTFIASGVTFNLGKSSLAREDNRHPKDFEYVLKGLRHGILTLEEPISVENDIESREFSGNLLTMGYPNTLTPPTFTTQMSNITSNVY